MKWDIRQPVPGPPAQLYRPTWLEGVIHRYACASLRGKRNRTGTRLPGIQRSSRNTLHNDENIAVIYGKIRPSMPQVKKSSKEKQMGSGLQGKNRPFLDGFFGNPGAEDHFGSSGPGLGVGSGAGAGSEAGTGSSSDRISCLEILPPHVVTWLAAAIMGVRDKASRNVKNATIFFFIGNLHI